MNLYLTDETDHTNISQEEIKRKIYRIITAWHEITPTKIMDSARKVNTNNVCTVTERKK